MLRRSWCCLLSLAEAQRMVQVAPATAAPAPLPKVLDALSTHCRTGGEDFVKAALQHVVRLDQSNTDTWHIANARVTDVQIAGGATGGVGVASPVDPLSAQPAYVHLIVELLRLYPNSPEVRERCCRCVANMCQLSADIVEVAADTTQPAPVSNPPRGETKEGDKPPLADVLVREGAVELILGTLSMARRLSPRGRCWAAMAMLNITCMSRGGAARATAAGAVDRLAELVLFLLGDSALREAASASPIQGLSEESAIALDAALGALAGVLAAEAPENASGVSYNYELVSFVAVDAVVRALLFVSALLVRDGRNDGAYGASLPSRRYGSVQFASASATQQAAVVVLLPLLHKAWMSLQLMCSCHTNLPIIFDVVYEAANTNQESILLADCDHGGTEEVLPVTTQTERQYVAALTSLVDAALFVTTELEGLEPTGASELPRLQEDVRLYVMDTMQAMTAPRKDVAPNVAGAAESGTSHSRSGATVDAGEAAEAAGTYPTTAAMNITDVLTTGTVSSMALACAVRLHTEHHDTDPHGHASGKADPNMTPPTVKPRLKERGAVPYDARHFTLLSKSLAVLANTAEMGDAVATSANTMAALHVILESAAEVITSLSSAYGADLAELFKPTEDAEGESSTPARPTSCISPEDRLSFLQNAALAGQVYAVLWCTLRSAHGVTLVSRMNLLTAAKQLRKVLKEAYQPALSAAKALYGAHSTARENAASCGQRQQQEASEVTTRVEAENGGKESSEAKVLRSDAWVANTAEETLLRLLKLSDELLHNTDRLSQKR